MKNENRLGWKECKLGEVAEIFGGGTPKTEIHEFWNGSIPWITPRDLSNFSGRFILKGERNISDLGLCSSSAKLLPKGSVLLSSRAPVGYLAISDCPISTNQGFRSLVPIPDKSETMFLYYLLKANVEYLISQASGTTFQELAGGVLKELLFLIPPLPEQHAIAAVLSSLDDKIDLLHRQNKTLEGIAEALWRKMFVEEADPGWKKGKLREIAEINPLRSIKKGAIATYLDMSNMPINGPFPTDWVQREFTSGIKFKNGDTLIARITPCLENGKTAHINFLSDGEIAWGSTEYIVLAPREGYCSEWFYFLARTDDFREFAIQNMTGTSGRQRVSGDSIAQYEIAIPPMNISEKFKIFVGSVMEHIKQNSFQIRTLSHFRDTLLPKLMSGEVSVTL